MAEQHPILGAHMSIAGGYYKAVEEAQLRGCSCVQLFTKNNNQWRGKALTDDDCQRFQTALRELKIAHPIAHDSYLINLAAPDETRGVRVRLLRVVGIGLEIRVIPKFVGRKKSPMIWNSKKHIPEDRITINRVGHR